MKIIKKGRCWYEGLKTVCDHCGGEFELEAGDSIKYNPVTNQTAVVCPTKGCLRRIYFNVVAQASNNLSSCA